jgi:hypothetical protein
MNALVLVLVMLAPAPRVVEKPLPSMAHGTYVMTWKGIDATTHFHADGFFACYWQGRWWHGTWKQERGRVAVEEWPLDQPESKSKWTIILTDPKSGFMTEGPAWKIRSAEAGGKIG